MKELPDETTAVDSTWHLDALSEDLDELALAYTTTFGHEILITDFNEDGQNDLIVAAPGYSSNIGAVHILFLDPNHQTNGSSDFRIQNIRTILSTSPIVGHDHFGVSLAAGDLNHDGIVDLAIGDPSYDTVSLYNMQLVDLPDGSRISEPTSLKALDSATPGLESIFAQSSTSFGSSLAIGDFNRDGQNDVAVGDWTESSLGSSTGAVYTVNLKTDGSRDVEKTDKIGHGTTNLSELASYDYFGYSLAAGDIDGDGWVDLAVGAIGGDVSTNVITGGASTDTIDDWIAAIETLPEFPRPNETVTITLDLEEGTYPGQEIAVPSGYKLVINDASGPIVFTGAVLSLPRIEQGRDRILERELRSIAARSNWAVQREAWAKLFRKES